MARYIIGYLVYIQQILDDNVKFFKFIYKE